MPIQNFEFPGVTLKQVFTEESYGTVSTLGTACVGQTFRLHRSDVASEAAKIDQSTTAYSPTSGLVNIDIPGRSEVLDEALDMTASTHRLVVKNGVYSYPLSSTAEATQATITTTDGINKIKCGFVVKTGNGYAADEGFGTRGAKVGDPVIIVDTATDDAKSPCSTYIIAILPDTTDNNKYNTIVVASLGSFTSTDTPKVKFCVYADHTYAESSSTFAINSTTEKLTIYSGLTADLKSEFSSTTAITGTLQSGEFYFEYREKTNSYVGQLGTVDTVSYAAELLGPAVPENPLSLAVYFALQAAAGTVVYFTGVRSEDTAGYTEALDFLEKYTNVYNIVPCTTDSDIIQACAGSVIAASDDENSKIRRALWYGIDTDAELTLYSGTTTTTAASGTTTLATVTFTGATPFVDYPVQEGDIVINQVNQGRYKIVSTNYVNMASVTPLDGAAAIEAGSGIIYTFTRTSPTNAQVIQSVIEKRGTQSLRCRCIWADDILFEGEVVPNFCGAAAAAGMRSGEECWRPLSNLTYSFFSVKEPHGFTRSQLKEVGANGIWIIGNNNDGTPTNLKALTTAVSNNINTDNESIVSNADEIALSLCHVGENMVGNSNISSTLLTLLQDQIDALLEARTKNGSSDTVGNQLLSFEITEIYQDESNLDTVYADIEVEPPKPFNIFHMTMRVI